MTPRLGEAELTSLATSALEGLGLAPRDAADSARILVLADLFGLHTHGVSRVASYGERVDLGGICAGAQVRVEKVAPAVARVDGANGLGPLVGMRALEAAMDLARECGVGMAFARASNHFGPISPYGYIAAEAGFATMIGSNATTTIAPWGGGDARLGNNPLGFGVPQPGGPPFLLDMAMSVAARAKIRSAAAKGEPIPATWATDAAGRPTTDAKAALDGFLQPVGGHKGYGLALTVDLFAGLLSGAGFLTHVSSWSADPQKPQDLGHFFIALDTTKLGAAEWLAGRMADFRAILHASPPSDPSSPVVVPGEIELARMARFRDEGIPLPQDVIDSLHAFAKRKRAPA
ncbi:MAG: Ldh family oxidoreductase [Betaproteobacteria bacterium]|nr:Ldh family oxidoreductase [Betaproteobacteria bacterium]